MKSRPKRWARRWLAVALMMLAVSLPALAGEHLSGIVLMTPSAGTVLVHHEPFSGMPAMTMTYRVPDAGRLHAGDRIRAEVDRSTEPWSLRSIAIVGSEMPRQQRRDPAFVRVGERVPSGTFLDQRGRPFSLDDLRGQPFALTFIYTRCVDPTMCPVISAKLRSVQRSLHGAAALVEISLDPAYDRPPVLTRYGQTYAIDPARWHLLTGDPRSVLDFAARFGILERSAGPVTIVHSERLAIIDRGGRIVRLFDNANWSPADVLTALARAS